MNHRYKIKLKAPEDDPWLDTDTVMVTLTYVGDNATGEDKVKLVPVKVDLDVDADYDGTISVDSPDDPIEVSDGGVVYVGKRKPIKLREVEPAGTASSAILTWTTSKIKVFTTDSGTAEVSSGDDVTLPATLWVQGESVSASPQDVTMTLEASGGAADEIAFTVVEVDKIEYCRLDKDQSVAGNWVTDENIAAGAKNTDVHKARVRITIKPVLANVSVTAARNGGNGDAVAGTLSPTSSQLTDSSGQVYCTYKSGDKIEDLTIKVTECAGSTVSIDLGSILHQLWDIGNDCVGTAVASA